MASAGSIYVDLLLKDSKYVEGLNKARRKTGDFSKGSSSDLKNLQSSFLGVSSAAIRFAGVIGAGLSLSAIATAADEVAMLSARIRQSTLSTQEFNTAFESLSKTALEVGTSLSNGVEIFQRLSFSRKELEATNEEMLAFSETVQKLGVTSGASGQALTAGLLQLGQGLSAGVLRAEEFNSIMENIPAIGTAIAEEFGVSVGQLRQLVLAGEVLSKDVLTAILNQQDEANAKFEQMPVTLGRGLATATQGASLFAASLNDALGVTTAIGSALQGIGEFLSESSDFVRFLSNPGKYAKDVEYNSVTKQMNQAMNKGEGESVRALSKDYAALASSVSGATKEKQAADKAAKELQSTYEKNREVITGLDTATLKYIDSQKELETLYRAGLISQQELGEAVKRLDEQYQISAESMNGWSKEMEAVANRAAENIQDAFADFLFDPFQDGLKGMLKGFVDTLRKMVAEQASANLLAGLFGTTDQKGRKTGGFLSSGGMGDFFKNIFAGSFADGGIIPPGQWGIVGEGGGMQHAEAVFGGTSGATVVPQGKGGNVYNIDARGADQGAVMRIQDALLTLAGPGVIEKRVTQAQQRGAL